MNKVKFTKSSITLPLSYFADVVKLADRTRQLLVKEYQREGLVIPLFFGNDIIYRASASWKDNPIHHAYIGDSSEQYIQLDDCRASEVSRLYLARLIGYASVVWEMGFQLVYHDDNKHAIYRDGCKIA